MTARCVGALVHPRDVATFLQPQITGSGAHEDFDDRAFSIEMPRMWTAVGKYSTLVLRRMSFPVGNYVRLCGVARTRDAREHCSASRKSLALSGFIAAARRFSVVSANWIYSAGAR